MPQTIEDLDLVRHSCMVPDSDEHVWEAASAWVTSGLRAGERVLYFEDETADRLLQRLADDRVPLDAAMADGQFQVIPTEVARPIVTGPIEGLEVAMRHAIEETAGQGWPGMRLLGEAARGRIDIGLDSLVAYERHIDQLLAQHPSTRLLCLYDRTRYEPDVVEALRAVHGTELAAPPAYDDGLLRVTRPVPSTLRLAGEIDHSNRSVLRRMLDGALEQTLRAVDVPVDVTMDLASLRFLDVAGAMELLRGAQQFPEDQRVVLRAPRSRVLRALQRCGAGSVGQLVVESPAGPSADAAGRAGR